MKYRIELIESERGWGQETWYEYFDTKEKAQERIATVNADRKPGPVPD